MWLTSNKPTPVRTAECSGMIPLYSTGIAHPPNGTIRALRLLCVSKRAVCLRSVTRNTSRRILAQPLTLTLHSYDAENMFATERTSFVKPPALQPGDQIGIVAPASNIKSEMLEAGCRELESLGFRTVYRPDSVKTHRYFSGTDERRAAELLTMVRNPDVKAIFC